MPREWCSQNDRIWRMALITSPFVLAMWTTHELNEFLFIIFYSLLMQFSWIFANISRSTKCSRSDFLFFEIVIAFCWLAHSAVLRFYGARQPTTTSTFSWCLTPESRTSRETIKPKLVQLTRVYRIFMWRSSVFTCSIRSAFCMLVASRWLFLSSAAQCTAHRRLQVAHMRTLF